MAEPSEEEKKEYEARLRKRLAILKEQVEAGKVQFAPGLKVIESLKAVRYAPDGTVDLTTVDGMVRSAALAVEAIHNREEVKKSISLAEIQSTYFGFLEGNFGQFYRVMVDRKLTPHDAGVALSRRPETIEELTRNLPDFLAAIVEFWQQTGDAAHAHVEDLHGALKGVFGGDLFPAHDENIASKCGLYTDTLVLPDPFLRSKDLFERWSPERRAYYLIKHGLNLLQYKDLAGAEVTPPIVVILPDRAALEEQEREFFSSLGRADALIHARKVFGRRFESIDELFEFAKSLDTVERVVAEVSDEERVLFDSSWKEDLRGRVLRATAEQDAQLLGTNHPGIIVASQGLGRMGVANELLVKAHRLRGTPIIDAPTSWQYFVWKLQYDAERTADAAHSNLADLHVVRGLQSLAENEMEWLGAIPPAALIEVRRADAIGEIRRILGKGIEEIAAANPTNFYRSADRVFDNIHAAFDTHRQNIREFGAKKWKFAGTDVASWLVVGSLAVAAAGTQQPVWGILALAAEQLLPAPKLRNIPVSIKELAKENEKLKRSPVGLLFRFSRGATRR